MYIELVKLERLGHDTTVQNHIPLHPFTHPPLTALYSSPSHPLLFLFHLPPWRPYLYLPSCWTSPTHVDESGGRNPQGRHRCCHWGMYPAIYCLVEYLHVPPLSGYWYTPPHTHSQTHPLFHVLTHKMPLAHPLSTHSLTHVCQHTLPYINPLRMYSHISSLPSPPPHTLTLLPPTQTYNLMSERWFTHASPTLFNAGTCRPQLSSCFLVCMKEDSIEVSPQEEYTSVSCPREILEMSIHVPALVVLKKIRVYPR